MSDHGCSKAFIAVAVFSFVYLVINVCLIASAKAWERTATWFIFILILAVVIVSLIGLGYSAAQSVCEINVCGEDYANHADDYWEYINKEDRKENFEDHTCDNASDDWISDAIAGSMSVYARTNAGKSFHIKRGWPIAFTVFQSICSIIHLFLTFFNLYSCSGCKPKPVNKGVTY